MHMGMAFLMRKANNNRDHLRKSHNGADTIWFSPLSYLNLMTILPVLLSYWLVVHWLIHRSRMRYFQLQEKNLVRGYLVGSYYYY